MLDRHKNDTKDRPYHEWKHTAPINPTDIHIHNGREFCWCTKCKNGKGQVASAHTTNTHINDFRVERHQQTRCGEHNECNGIPNNSGSNLKGKQIQAELKQTNVSFIDTPTTSDTQTNTINLSLSDGIDHRWYFDVQNLHDNE